MNNMNNQVIVNNVQNNPGPAPAPKSQIERIIDYYYRENGDLLTHSKLAELITLIHIAFEGHENIKGFLKAINEKCHKGLEEVMIDNYVEMINAGQLEIKDAVKELFTIENLNYYGI